MKKDERKSLYAAQRALALEYFPALELPKEANAPDGDCELAETPPGVPTLLLQGRALHSKRDPVREAERQAGSIQTEDEEQLVLFFGAGLGYALREFCLSRPNPCVWFEPDARILTHALSVTDVREFIRRGRLILLDSIPDEDGFSELFRGRGNRRVIFHSFRAVQAPRTPYAAMRDACERFLNKKDVNLATIARFDETWARNICSNFISLIRARPVSLLFNSCPDGRAIVCGAGPSLGDSIPLIRERRERDLIIAADTALGVLVKHGIDPHIVVSVDPQPINRAFFEGYEGEAIFVLDPTTSRHSLRLLDPERIFFTASPFPLTRALFDFLAVEPGEIAFGGSVSTNAYDLAIQLGCTRICLFGQDMAFSGGLAHARGAVLEERLNFLESRLFRRELHNYRQLSALPVRLLPAIGGGEIGTNDKLLIFHSWLKGRIARDLEKGLSVFNCTARGAILPGVPPGPPEDFSEPVATLPAFQAGLQEALARSPESLFRRADFIAFLREFIEEIDRFAEMVARGETIAEEVLTLAGEKRNAAREARYGELLHRAQKQDQEIRERLNLSEILGGSMQRVILQITEDYGDYLTPEEKKNPDRKTARQSHLLYTHMRESCAQHARWLGKTLLLLED